MANVYKNIFLEFTLFFKNAMFMLMTFYKGINLDMSKQKRHDIYCPILFIFRMKHYCVRHNIIKHSAWSIILVLPNKSLSL